MIQGRAPSTANQQSSFAQSEVSRYWDDGFVFPIRVLSEQETNACRSELETIEHEFGNANLPRPLKEYLRVHSHTVLPLAARLATHVNVLNAVEAILGSSIMIWGAEFFIKEAHSDKIVSMHQDLTYWGFGDTSNQVTAWIALSPATVESGCMELVKASHKNAILPHTDTHAENNMLSRGQEVNVDVNAEDCTPIILQPGEMSLHHGLTIHGSKENRTNDRRIGFAIRYINPEAVQLGDHREYTMMARGIDNSSSFKHYAPPSTSFAEPNLSLYEEIRHEQAKVLAAGMEDKSRLFSS